MIAHGTEGNALSHASQKDLSLGTLELPQSSLDELLRQAILTVSQSATETGG